jgi:predicted metal-binding membrane protein
MGFAMLRQYAGFTLVGTLSLALLCVVLWALPKWQASGVQDLKDRLTIENAARQTLAQIVGGAVLIAGLFFTWANLNVAQENISTMRSAFSSQTSAWTSKM